jgi:beta-galactosidase
MQAGRLRPASQPAPAYPEAMQVAEELEATGIEGEAAPARVGIVYDYASEWAWQIQPQARGFSHYMQVRGLYSAFRKRGIDIDILPPSTRNFSGYDVVCIPALFAWTEALREAIAHFEGRLLIGPRTGSKTEEFAIPAGLAPDLPQNLLDVKVARVDSTNPGYEVSVKGGGAVHHWRERLDTRAEVVLEDEEGFPVLVAQGRVSYLAAAGDKALLQRVVDRLIEDAALSPLDLPAGVRCRKRGGVRIYVNYAATGARLTPAADERGYVLGSAEIGPAGVTVARLATAG